MEKEKTIAENVSKKAWMIPVLFGLMCAFFIGAVAVIEILDYFNANYGFSIGAEIVSMMIAIVITVPILAAYKRKGTQVYMFVIMLAMGSLLCFLNITMMCLDESNLPVLMNIHSGLVFIVEAIFTFSYWLFMSHTLKTKKKITAILDIIALVLLLVFLILPIVNFFTPIYYYIDEFGKYQYADLRWLSYTYLGIVLGEHCRRTYGIDVIVKDPDAFYDDVRKAVSSCGSDLSFDVAYVKKKEASERYYKNTFSFRVTCRRGEETIGMIIVDGVYLDDYESMHKVVYKGPEIIDKDFCFYGVDIEYVAREIILAISSELPRPIKHLVDVYSLSKIDLDIKKLQRYLEDGFAQENRMRELFGKPLLTKDYAVKDEKKFLGNYVYEMISSGYPLRFKEMKESVNAWLKATLSA